jgi:primosomal protein N' (replication factor Y)
MREELIEGNKMIFSRKLYSEVKSNLEKKEQTILFLNRRGYDTFVSCRQCGFVAKCLNCNIALTYHNESNKLICHYCGAKYKNFDTCPVCKSSYIKHFGIGTQKVEETVKKLFPQASVIRMDLDTTSKKNSHEEILKEFRDNNIDILIGTQMIAKGHDFPNVTLVGVIAADTSLNMNDFRAAERTFNLLTQVSGRAGRGEKEGRVVVQTYESENCSILAAKEHDYDKFYNQEVKIREQLNYPPFCDIIIVNISGRDEKTVIEGSKLIREILNEELKHFDGILVLPEVPAPVSKINKKFRWRIMIKCKLTKEISDVINNLLISKKIVKIKEVDWTIELNPVTFN